MTSSDRRSLSAGKLRGMISLADERGVFKMVAVDQRPPIFKALARHGNRDVSDVGYEEIAAVKRLLTKILAPQSTAILIDPIWTHPHVLESIPGRVGLISTLEDHNFELRGGERWSYPIEGWSVEKIRRTGASAVKILLWDRPDVRADTRAHQDRFVMQVGDACRRFDIPFILELVTYTRDGEVEESAEHAAAKPERVIGSVAHYSDEAFGVDLFKLQFPADLKYCMEYAHGEFDGQRREAAYSLGEVSRLLAELHASTDAPWVLLSAGVGPKEFQEQLRLAFAAGASGFLAGRAIWLDALDNYPDVTAIEVRLNQRSLPYLRKIADLANEAASWRAHPRYGGKVVMEGRSSDWYKRYGS